MSLDVPSSNTGPKKSIWEVDADQMEVINYFDPIKIIDLYEDIFYIIKCIILPPFHLFTEREVNGSDRQCMIVELRMSLSVKST